MRNLGVVLLACALLSACAAPLRRPLPTRGMLKVVAGNDNSANGDLIGVRGEWEMPLIENFSYHFSLTYLESQDFDFVNPEGRTWDEVSEFATGMRNWFQAGPVLLGAGAEIGYGTQGHGEDTREDEDEDDSDRWVFAVLGSARVDIGEPAWGISLEADGQYRIPFSSENTRRVGGVDPDDVLSGWVFFLGVGLYF